MKNYQKMYCVNLELREIDAGYMLPFACPREFYCGITRELCVGNRRVGWRKNKVGIDYKVVARCPSRKTVESLLSDK